jgi:hypothetical protein
MIIYIIKLSEIKIIILFSLKAEWLYSQGKGRHFRPGQHLQLLEYLSKTCCLNSNETASDEVRLSKVLEKQQHYLPTLEKSSRDCISPSSNISQLNSNTAINDQIQNLKLVLNNNTSFEEGKILSLIFSRVMI